MFIDLEDSNCILLHSVCEATCSNFYTETSGFAWAFKLQHIQLHTIRMMLKLEIRLPGDVMQLYTKQTGFPQSLEEHCLGVQRFSYRHFCGQAKLYLLTVVSSDATTMDNHEVDPYNRPPLPRRRVQGTSRDRYTEPDLDEIHIRPPLPRRGPSKKTSQPRMDTRQTPTAPLTRGPVPCTAIPQSSSSANTSNQEAVHAPRQGEDHAAKSPSIQMVCVHTSNGKQIQLKTRTRSLYDKAKGAGKASKNKASKKIAKVEGAGKSSGQGASQKIVKHIKPEQAASTTDSASKNKASKRIAKIKGAGKSSGQGASQKIVKHIKPEQAASTTPRSKARPKRKAAPAGPPRGSIAEALRKRLRSEPISRYRVIDTSFWSRRLKKDTVTSAS